MLVLLTYDLLEEKLTGHRMFNVNNRNLTYIQIK